MIRLKRLLGLPLTDLEIIAVKERMARNRLYAYLGPDAALAQLYDGQFIVVDPQDEQISVQIVARGYWEPGVETCVMKMLKPGDRVVEVGANIGYYTLLMARRVGPTGRIDAFEANPRLAALLARSIALNAWHDRVTVHVKAASNAPGPIPFVTSRRLPGGGHIRAGAGDFGVETVAFDAEGTRLDDAVSTRPVDMLRLDAEGCEPLIIAGALGILAYSPNLKICMEWDRVQMQPRADIGAFVDGLEAAGMKFWLMENHGELTPVTKEVLVHLPHRDIVAARVQPF